MSKRQWLTLLGVWIMVFLFLGVPSLWHKILALISGLIIILIAYNLPADSRKEKNSGPETTSSFIENDIPHQ